MLSSTTGTDGHQGVFAGKRAIFAAHHCERGTAEPIETREPAETRVGLGDILAAATNPRGPAGFL
jgi:hypothetical protein